MYLVRFSEDFVILVTVHAGISTNPLCHCEAVLTLSNNCLLPPKLIWPLHFPFASKKSSMQECWWAEGVLDTEISGRVSAQYGNSVSPGSSVYEWYTIFKNGHSVNDEQPGHPYTSSTDGKH
jgi:hypothetical protein